MGIGGIWQWVIVAVVIILLFGTKKLRNVGKDLGTAVKGFKTSMASDDTKKEAEPVLTADESEASTQANADAKTSAEQPSK